MRVTVACVLIASLASLYTLEGRSDSLTYRNSSEKEVLSMEGLSPHEGAVVQQVFVLGLTRTSESAVRDLLGAHEGEVFSADRWLSGIKKLYNTGALYNIETDIQEVSPSPDRKIIITLKVQDKWTLLPYVLIQGGGGQTLLGLGVYDRNLGGHFTNSRLMFGENSSLWMYEIKFFQEWYRDTDWMFGISLSRTVSPTSVIDRDGNAFQNFNWFRNQQQISLGRRFGNYIRFLSYLALFEDTLTPLDTSTTAQVYSGIQYNVQPTLILGRSNLTNYLEEGSEARITPNFVNFFDSNRSYSQLVLSYKKTSIVQKEGNLAVLGSFGVMSDSVLPYQFRLGGLDSIRGFSTNRALGSLYIYGNFEYRPTLFDHHFSWGFLSRIALQGNVFVDTGWIQGHSLSAGSSVGTLFLASAGLGVRLIFVKYSNAIVRFDWARTISPNDGDGVSFGLGQFF